MNHSNRRRAPCWSNRNTSYGTLPATNSFSSFKAVPGTSLLPGLELEQQSPLYWLGKGQPIVLVRQGPALSAKTGWLASPNPIAMGLDPSEAEPPAKQDWPVCEGECQGCILVTGQVTRMDTQAHSFKHCISSVPLLI